MPTEIATDVLRYNDPLETLPLELIEAIFKKLPTRDLKSLCLANKRIHAIAKTLLWREPQLKNFTLEEFKWISRMPIKVLDTSRLISFHNGKNCFSFDEFDLPFVTELSKFTSQMDYLDHLKLPWDFITAKKELWSILVDQCKIRTVSLCPSDAEDSRDFIHFLKEQLPLLKCMKSLIVEYLRLYFDKEELILSSIIEENMPSDISKLTNITMNVNISSDQYAMLFKMLSVFSGLRKLHLYICIFPYICDFHEIEFLKAKSDFMVNHPQCGVDIEIYIDKHHDSLDSGGHEYNLSLSF